MIALRKHIYDTLISSGLANGEIHTWGEDETERKDWKDIFPQITYQRISLGMASNTAGIRVETWQISLWSRSLLESEEMAKQVVEIFNRTQSQVYKSCSLISLNSTHDHTTKTHGTHARFYFVVSDHTF